MRVEIVTFLLHMDSKLKQKVHMAYLDNLSLVFLDADRGTSLPFLYLVYTIIPLN